MVLVSLGKVRSRRTREGGREEGGGGEPLRDGGATGWRRVGEGKCLGGQGPGGKGKLGKRRSGKGGRETQSPGRRWGGGQPKAGSRRNLERECVKAEIQRETPGDHQGRDGDRRGRAGVRERKGGDQDLGNRREEEQERDSSARGEERQMERDRETGRGNQQGGRGNWGWGRKCGGEDASERGCRERRRKREREKSTTGE